MVKSGFAECTKVHIFNHIMILEVPLISDNLNYQGSRQKKSGRGRRMQVKLTRRVGDYLLEL